MVVLARPVLMSKSGDHATAEVCLFVKYCRDFSRLLRDGREIRRHVLESAPLPKAGLTVTMEPLAKAVALNRGGRVRLRAQQRAEEQNGEGNRGESDDVCLVASSSRRHDARHKTRIDTHIAQSAMRCLVRRSLAGLRRPGIELRAVLIERYVGERLRKVSEQPPRVRIVFFGQQAKVILQCQQLLEQP